MVKFKKLKFKHYKTAMALDQRIKAGDASMEELFTYAGTLVLDWDFTDVENGHAKISPGDLDELTTEQLSILMDAFNGEFSMAATVPNPNGSP